MAVIGDARLANQKNKRKIAIINDQGRDKQDTDCTLDYKSESRRRRRRRRGMAYPLLPLGALTSKFQHDFLDMNEWMDRGVDATLQT